MDSGAVDRLNRRIGVRVGGQQDALGVGEKLHRLSEEFHPGHLRHPLIDQKQRHRIAPPLEPLQRLQGGRAGVSAQHSVVLGIPAAQVTLDRAQYFRVVVNRQQYGLCHSVAFTIRDKGQIRAKG